MRESIRQQSRHFQPLRLTAAIECRTLYGDYVMHMQTLHANAILNDWTRFRFASLVLASRIREHIKCERREVYPFFGLPEVKITPQPLPYKPPAVR